MPQPEDISTRQSRLSPVRRALLAKWKHGNVADAPDTQSIPRRSGQDSVPLSFAQQRLWFWDQLEPGNSFYNVCGAFRLSGSLHVEMLERSLREVVRRHESLRTIFQIKNDQPAQIVQPELDTPLCLIELNKFSRQPYEAEIERLTQDEVQRPFELACGPSLRTTLLRLGENEHILLLSMPHIVSDGWSKEIFLHELGALYNAFVLGEAVVLPELPIQYADYTLWQQQWLRGDGFHVQMDYWKQQLAGAPLLDFPTDYPRPLTQTYHGAHQYILLPVALLKQLKGLSKQAGVTLFMLLLAAFQVLCARYSGQTDIVVGTPVANRTRPEVERLIGFFVNTLVMRTDLSANPSFLSLLGRVREVVIGAFTHQEVPFEKLVAELQLERTLSYTPLFQILFALHTSVENPDLAKLALTSLTVESGTAKFDLSFELVEMEQGLHGTVEYNTDLFKSSTISRLLGHWQRLLEGIVAQPSQTIATLPLLFEDEREHWLRDWNATEQSYPATKGLHQLVEEQVLRDPERIALVFQEEQLSYGELDWRATQLALVLRQHGVEQEELVGICLERSLEMVIGLLGILKAGGAYIPLDPSYPSERLAFMLQDSQVRVLLTQQELLERLGGASGKVQVLCLDTPEAFVAAGAEDEQLPHAVSWSDQLAYVIYTSGSTGQPKGAMNTHRGIVNRLHWMQRAYQLHDTDRVLQKTSFSFDVSIWEFFWPLLSGACLILAEPGRQGESHYLVELIKKQAISTLHFVPSMLQAFVQEAGLEECYSLRRVICSGEALARDLQECFFARSDADLYNLYGPTEAAVDVTAWKCQRTMPASSVPIGYPIANTKIYVLDAGLEAVPVGVVGELYIGGVGVARGYWRRAALTAELFLPDPYSLTGGERLYRSGDLARYREDSSLEYAGRVDGQVKVRGFRIETGEIEERLRQHQAVRECVVTAREEKPGTKRLIAYVVSADPYATPSGSELREYLGARLPDYMLPAFFIVLEALPLLSNGKVDRRALPAPVWTRSEDKVYVAPDTAIEKALATIWADVLHVPRIGIDDNFFDLSGDSILSIQVVAKASQIGLHITPKQLFKHQTIAALSQVVESSSLMQAEQNLVVGSLPLLPIQHWFFEHHLSNIHHWNQARLIEILEPLNGAYLVQVVRACIEHHDALRLRFAQQEAGWRQYIVEPEEHIPFFQVDLSTLVEHDQDAFVMKIIQQAQESLNITEGPLLRGVYFYLGSSQKGLLLIIIHHLAVDGVSWHILLEDLQIAYQQLKQGQIIKLPLKTNSFKQWAEHLLEFAGSSELQHELLYWLPAISAKVSPLPLDYPIRKDTANTMASTHAVFAELTAWETTALLEEVPLAYHTQINDVLLTVLLQTFVKWTGRSSLYIDMEGHGREDIFADIYVSRTVGWFTSLFPVFLSLEGDPTLSEALQTVKEQLRHIPQHGIGYGILRYLSTDTALSQQLQALPQPEVLFNYLGQVEQKLSSSGLLGVSRLDTGRTRDPQGARSHLLEINFLIKENQLHMLWEYNEHFHRRETVENLATTCVDALRALIIHCQSPEAGGYTPSDFPDVELSSAQLEQIFVEMDLD